MLELSHDFILRQLNGQSYLIPIAGSWAKSAEVIHLNEVALKIIELLPAGEESILKEIVDTYEVDYETARCDLKEAIAEFVNIGIIKNPCKAIS